VRSVNLGRNPLLLVFALIFLLLFIVLPMLTNRGGDNKFSAEERGLRTFEALRLIDRGEQAYAKANEGKFTSELAGLVAGDPKLRDDLALTPITVTTLSAGVSGGKQAYYVQLQSDIVSLGQTRVAGSKPVLNCVILKKTSGVDCPVGSITRDGVVPPPETTSTAD
jgi:hypothetical protein